jgi:hypothetical protein
MKLLLFLLLFLHLFVFLLEAFHASGRVDDTLFAREERMAGGADIHVEILAQCGRRLDGIPACAGDGHFFPSLLTSKVGRN